MTTVKFRFEIDQEVHTPDGSGIIGACGQFWQPDGARRIRYCVETDQGQGWYGEDTLANLNRRPVATGKQAVMVMV